MRMRSLLLAACLAGSSIPAETFELTLEPGWNLVSIPIAPEDTSIADVLQGHGTGPVWGWDGNAFFRAQTIVPGQGYWVFVRAGDGSGNERVGITITGELPPKANIALTPGWNLAGPLPGYEFFPDLLLQPWSWNRDTTGYLKPGGQTWKPGDGYWLHTDQPKLVDFRTYTLGGRIAGPVVDGVVMTLLDSTGTETTTVTAPDGTYAFTGLRSGVNRITPSAMC